jgi:uncharacterized protein YbaR (Trm112 family)
VIKKELLDILACPECKGDLEYKENCLICNDCLLAYPVEQDIPIMLKEKARRIDRGLSN